MQMRDAGFKIIFKACHSPRKLLFVQAPELVSGIASCHRRDRLIRRQSMRFDLAPAFVWHLVADVADFMRQTALPQRAREDLFDRAAKTWRTIDATRIGSFMPRALRSRRHSRCAVVSSLLAAYSPSNSFSPVEAMPHAARTGSAVVDMKPFRHAIDEQVQNVGAR